MKAGLQFRNAGIKPCLHKYLPKYEKAKDERRITKFPGRVDALK